MTLHVTRLYNNLLQPFKVFTLLLVMAGLLDLMYTAFAVVNEM